MLKQISASAGSGKTYTLTQHFLSLLKGAQREILPSGCILSYTESSYPKKYGLGEILAATFTNKAAAEMKNRIINALKTDALESIKQHPEKISQEEAWLSAIFRNYSHLNVRTIDSLLSLLVRLSALELSLSPDFQPSFDSAEYFTPVYDGLMEDLTSFRQGYDVHFYTNDGEVLLKALINSCRSLIILSDVKGFRPGNRLRESLLELVHRKLLRLPLPQADSAALYARLKELHSAFIATASQLSALLQKEELKASSYLIKFLESCPTIDMYAGPKSATCMTKGSLNDCLNKPSKGMASQVASDTFCSLSALYSTYQQELPLIKQALHLANLTSIAMELHSRVVLHLQRTGLLPVMLLPILAKTILQGEFGVSDALCRMGSNLTHMLLDEFQDTSIDQWQAIMPLALESLSHGGSLTYVGDVKQAIYGWRGGDASLFDSALEEKELLLVSPDPLKESLPYNWRSSKTVIEHNNAFFSLLADQAIAHATLKAMLPRETPSQYIEQATELVSRVYGNSAQKLPPHKEKSLADDGRVVLYTVEGSSTSSVEQLVYERLSQLFHTELPSKFSYGEIAVLVRSSSEERLIGSWLTEWHIPVVTENSFILSSHPLVKRLISFLTFIDYPFDDLSFWEFISGPECFGHISSIDASTLENWVASLGNRSGIPLFRFFRSTYTEEWKKFIEPFYNQAGLMSAYDLLMEIFRHFNLLETDAAPFLRRMLEIAHLAENRGFSSLAAFLDFWDNSATEEKLPLPDTMDAVRIMTMHKAKGLEFPVVITPFLHRGKRHTPTLTNVVIDGQEVLTRASKELPEVYYPACVTEELERLNLLYVAWTRPVKELHAFITRPKSIPTPLMKGLEVLLNHYKQYHEGLCSFEEITVENIVENSNLTNTSQATENNLTADAHKRKTSEQQVNTACYTEGNSYQTVTDPVQNTAKEENSLQENEPWYPMSWLPRLKIFRSNLEDLSFSAKQRGIFVHSALEYLRFSGDISVDVDHAVAQALNHFIMPMDGPEALVDEAKKCLYWFAHLPKAQFWLEQGLREQAIIDQNGQTHRVDLLVKENGVLYAIDYKTGEESPESHIRQVKKYMQLVSNALHLPAQGILLYLDQQKTVQVKP